MPKTLIRHRLPALAATAALAACASPAAVTGPADSAQPGLVQPQPAASPAPVPLAPRQSSQLPVTRTVVADPTALARLKGATGVTLQWISWDYRGPVDVTETDGVVHIAASQMARGGPGALRIAGDVVRITSDTFTFRGTIAITDTPDPGRQCVLDTAATGDVQFAITQDRKYWRLRTFEWCDGLTDYIDIYF